VQRDRIEFPEITREQIKEYAEVSGDFNQIHLSDEFARAAGLPSVIAHGMYSMGLASVALERWGFEISMIHDIEAKFKEKVYPGEKLIAEFLGEKSLGADFNSIEFRLIKADGTEVLHSSASIVKSQPE